MLTNCLAKHPTDLLECTKLSNSNFIVKLHLYNLLCYSKAKGLNKQIEIEKKGAREYEQKLREARVQRAGHSPTASGDGR